MNDKNELQKIMENIHTRNRIILQEPDIKYFVNYCLTGGAIVTPMDIDIHDQLWPGWCNPSIMWDEKDQDFKMIIRNVNYVLHGASNYIKNWSSWGPVHYSIPTEDGRNLKTRNFIGSCKDPENESWNFQIIDTTPYEPQWEFQGQEDARILRWDNNLYTTGVRRDDNTEGRGRMELMALSDNGYQEISRVKVKALNDDSYCEKNWMPIKDMPFHYVQLTNPTVVVKTDPETGETEEVIRKEYVEGMVDERFDLLRGSSQVVRWGDYWITLAHTCELWLTASGRKYAKYCHVFVVWDEDWNIIKMSPLFSFANYNIEFTCGLEYHNGKFYIPFAIQDNFTFVMTVDECVIDNFIWNKTLPQIDNIPALIFDKPNTPIHLNIFRPLMEDGKDYQQDILYKTGMWYFEHQFFAAAYCIFTRSIELFDYTYAERFMAARCIADLSHRDVHELAMWTHTIMEDPDRPEAYMAKAMYHKYRSNFIDALYYANMAMERLDENKGVIYYTHDIMKNLHIQCMWDSPYYENVKDFCNQVLFNEPQDNKRIL